MTVHGPKLKSRVAARQIRTLFATVFLLAATTSALPPAKAEPLTHSTFKRSPKLIVLIVVDQLRSDYLTKFSSRFLPPQTAGGEMGGFNFLMNRGAYFPFAEYDTLLSLTAPGHAMLLTGAYPYQMGIPLNSGVDRTTGKSAYCADDPEAIVVGAPTGKGISPRNLISTTVGDELKNAGFKSTVVSVALKDRASVLMGGKRADLALWFNDEHFSWTTSSFYMRPDQWPAWINGVNQDLKKQKGKKYSWVSKGKGSGLTINARKEDDKEFVRDYTIGSREALAGPLGVDITTDVAMHSVDEMKLGHGQGADILAVSYSSHDYMGHDVGPNSRDLEEMTVYEDRSISKLINHVRRRVPGGLDEVVFVLTADHGTPPLSSYLTANRIDSARMSGSELLEKLETGLNRRFGKASGDRWFVGQQEFNFFLADAALAGASQSRKEIEDAAKDILRDVPGVAFVFSRTDVFNRTLPAGGGIERRILKSFFPARSGDVVMIPRPYYMEEGPNVIHMTGYSYDRTVPLVFAGKRFRPGVYPQKADIVDIAPTLSFLLGIVAPPQNEGRVLAETLVP